MLDSAAGFGPQRANDTDQDHDTLSDEGWYDPCEGFYTQEDLDYLAAALGEQPWEPRPLSRQERIQVAQALGLLVHPCGERKQPLLEDWPNAASTDPDTIRHMFSMPGAALIGYVTGPRSGISVLDCDTARHQSARAWLWNARHHLPPTTTFRTRSGGLHLQFRHVDGVRNSEGKITNGIDIRGDGGQCIHWFAEGCECLDHTLPAEFPPWLLDQITRKEEPNPLRRQQAKPFKSNGQNAQDRVDRALRRVESAADGQRHATLRAASCTIGGLLDAAGLTEIRASRLLFDAVKRAGGDDVKDSNALNTIAWGLKRGAASPLMDGGRS